MPHTFRAIAIDYDGTLVHGGGRPSAAVLEALATARAEGRRLVLVTGRILADLRRVFPDVDERFDAVVAENGAVLARAGEVRPLAAPVPDELAAVLATRGVPVDRGLVLLATLAYHDTTVLGAVSHLGLDVQLVHNRGSLMLLPPGVSKASGLHEALGDLGISYHSTIAVGDAENDHALLDAAEVGVAVANAIDALKEHADVVLSRPDGEGVASLVGGPIVRGELRVHPRRWQVELGTDDDGAPVRVPASGVNVLVQGGTGSGKSYLAGLLAERLVQLGYSLCVLDPEGDHVALGGVRGVVAVGGLEGLPPPAQLGRLIRHRFGSVVADLSLLSTGEKEAYFRAALTALHASRAATGLPHWIILDEAHVPVGAGGLAREVFDPAAKGLCLVTYQPEELWALAREDIDVAVSLGGLARGRARLELRAGGAHEFTVGRRGSVHVRHWHKYVHAQLPPHHRFFFLAPGRAGARSAGNLEEFHRELRACAAEVLRHHAAGGDFSRWIGQIIRDDRLARAVEAIERGVDLHGPDAVEEARTALLAAIERRYLEADAAAP